MKRFIAAIILAALFTICLISCTNQNDPVGDITTNVTQAAKTIGEVYENDSLQMGLTFPKEYIGKYTIIQLDVDCFSVFHTASYELSKENESKEENSKVLGYLFGIERWPLSDEDDIRNMNELASVTPLFQANDYAYFLRRPTRIEYDESAPEPWQTAEYKLLSSNGLIEQIIASVFAIDVNNITSDYSQELISTVRTLVSLDFLGREYSDNVTNEYVQEYIYHLAMQNYFDRAKAYEGPMFDSRTEYVAFSKDELAGLLGIAFGERFSIENLKPQVDEHRDYQKLIYDSETYYVSIGETLLANVEFLNNIDEFTSVYSYDVESSIIKANGEVTVKVAPSGDSRIGVSIVSMAIDEQNRVNIDE